MDPIVGVNSQGSLVCRNHVDQCPEIDVWEPPFERWMRLADSLLSRIPASQKSVPIRRN